MFNFLGYVNLSFYVGIYLYSNGENIINLKKEEEEWKILKIAIQ